MSQIFEEARNAVAEANKKYEQAVNLMAEIEQERSKLLAAGPKTERIKSIAKRLMPLIMKYGSAIAGGGGIAALAADPGAFKGLLEKIFGAS